jgi:hypothetical protein
MAVTSKKDVSHLTSFLPFGNKRFYSLSFSPRVTQITADGGRQHQTYLLGTS